MSADRLREAAQKVRKTANAAAAVPPWPQPGWVQEPLNDLRRLGFDKPPVALAMADWLDEAADMIDAEDVGQSDHPLRIANLILGAP